MIEAQHRHAKVVLVTATLGDPDRDILVMDDQDVSHEMITGELTTLVIGAAAVLIDSCPNHADPTSTVRVALFDVNADPDRIHPLILAWGLNAQSIQVAYHDWGFAHEWYKPEGYDEDRAVAAEEARTESLLSHWGDGTIQDLRR